MSIRLIFFVLISFGCKLLCQHVSTEVMAGSTKLRQSKWYTAWGNEGDPEEKMPCFWWVLFPFLTPSNLSHHCNFYKNVPPLPCQNLTKFCPRFFTAPWPAPTKMHQTTNRVGPSKKSLPNCQGETGFLLLKTAKSQKALFSLKYRQLRQLRTGQQFNDANLDHFTCFFCFRCRWVFLKISNCLEPGNWPKTKRLRAKDVIGSWNQGHSEDQNCPFSCDVSESQYLIIYPNHPFRGVVVLSSGAAFLYCF